MFRVQWKHSARNELANLWMNADSTQRRAIDRRLQVNPHNQGESRPNGRRVYFAPPLGVLYRVDLQQSLVHILRVWLF